MVHAPVIVFCPYPAATIDAESCSGMKAAVAQTLTVKDEAVCDRMRLSAVRANKCFHYIPPKNRFETPGASRGLHSYSICLHLGQKRNVLLILSVNDPSVGLHLPIPRLSFPGTLPRFGAAGGRRPYKALPAPTAHIFDVFSRWHLIIPPRYNISPNLSLDVSFLNRLSFRLRQTIYHPDLKVLLYVRNL